METTQNDDSEATFCNINEAARRTGLSAWFIRQNIKDIPHCKAGKKYMIHLEGLKKWALSTADSNNN